MASPFTTNAKVLALFNQGLVQPLFKNPMIPALLYRGEFTQRPWDNQALSVWRTKNGSLNPNAVPLAFRTDPTTRTYNREQWEADIAHFADSVENDKIENNLAAVDLWRSDMATLGTGAAKTILVKSRAKLLNTALAGHTLTTTVGAGTSKTVLRLNGFTRSFYESGRYEKVSATNPLVVYMVESNGSLTANTIVGFTPDTAGDEFGPGSVTLGETYTSTSRQAMVAATASKRILAGGSATNTIDDIGSTDALTVEMVREAVAHLRDIGVQPHEDGFFHLHCSNTGLRQLRKDPEIQLLFRGKGLSPAEVSNPYVRGDLQVLEDCIVIPNSYAPQPGTIGTFLANGDDCAALVANATSGVGLHTAVVTGGGKSFENWRTPLAAEANQGIHRLGDWQVSEDGGSSYARADVDRIELVLRPPVDKLGRIWTFSWSYEGGFEVETDYLSDKAGAALPDLMTGASDRAAYKHAVSLVHAG